MQFDKSIPPDEINRRIKITVLMGYWLSKLSPEEKAVCTKQNPLGCAYPEYLRD